ncbi:hypothetical protein JCM15908A_14120 [Prevotella dentasini JCM 15908]
MELRYSKGWRCPKTDGICLLAEDGCRCKKNGDAKAYSEECPSLDSIRLYKTEESKVADRTFLGVVSLRMML